jgi:hypothetical protein
MEGMRSITITLPENEWRLVAALLEMASDRFSTHGCNDLPKRLCAMLSDSEWKRIAREHYGDADDEFEAGHAQGDDTLMDYYAEKIKCAVETAPEAK